MKQKELDKLEAGDKVVCKQTKVHYEFAMYLVNKDGHRSKVVLLTTADECGDTVLTIKTFQTTYDIAR